MDKEKSLQIYMRLKEKVTYPLRRMFLRQKSWVGDYADTLMRMKEWCLNQNIIIRYYWHTKEEFVPVGNVKDAAPQERKELKRIQEIIIRKELKKVKRMILFYYEDNQITRGLGCKETSDHWKIMGSSEMQDEATKIFIAKSEGRMNAYTNRRTRRASAKEKERLSKKILKHKKNRDKDKI